MPNSLSGHNAREESERVDKNGKLGEKEEDWSAHSELVEIRQSVHVDYFFYLTSHQVNKVFSLKNPPRFSTML